MIKYFSFLKELTSKDRTPPAGAEPATFVDGVANMAVLDAIRASHAAGGAYTAVVL